MSVDFKYLPEFERRAKILAKKYKSFIKDYDEFLNSLAKIRSRELHLVWVYIKLVWQ